MKAFPPLVLSLHIVFLLSTLSISVAQTDLVKTPAYQSNGALGFPNPKAIAVGSDGFARFVIGDSSPGPVITSDKVTYVRCLSEDCSTVNTATFSIDGYNTVGYSIALGPDDLPRIAYSNFSGPNVPLGHQDVLGFISCADVDCASFTNTIVDGGSGSGVASIAVGADGTSYVVYDDGNDIDGPQGVGLATCSGASCSTVHIADIGLYDCLGAAVTIGSDGNPVIAFVDDNCHPHANNSVHYYANGVDTIISNDVGGYDFIDLTIAADGFARIIFPNSVSNTYNASTGVDFVQCTNASCSSHNTRAILSPGPGASYGSGAAGADGNPRILVGVGGIDYVSCSSPDCSSYSDEVLAGDWSGQVFSLAPGTDGLPRMLTQDPDYLEYQVRALPTVPIPVNFHQTNHQDLGNGVLGFQYEWESSTGNLDDLSSCLVGEYVTYPGIGNFVWPTPLTRQMDQILAITQLLAIRVRRPV